MTSVGDAMRPGEFPIQFWREAGLLHPTFAKRALASVSAGLVRRSFGQLREGNLARLDQSLRLWLGLQVGSGA